MGKIWKSILGSIAGIGVFAVLAVGATAASNIGVNTDSVMRDGAQSAQLKTQEKQEQEQIWETCDGVKVTTHCVDEGGNKYSKYVFHEAEPEKTEEVYHAATQAKTHTVYHPAEYGTRTYKECIKTSIKYKSGTCALSQCRDGSYSGSTGRGTCSYHGGVARSGGPWYTTRTETYEAKKAWTETVVDVPAKAAWTETVVVSPAKEAWTEKELWVE